MKRIMHTVAALGLRDLCSKFFLFTKIILKLFSIEMVICITAVPCIFLLKPRAGTSQESFCTFIWGDVKFNTWSVTCSIVIDHYGIGGQA